MIIDLVKVFQKAGKLKTNPACRTPCLDKGTVITTEDLQAGLKLYNVDAARRRRGVPAHRLGRPVRAVSGAKRSYNSGEPGIGNDGCEWLMAQKVVVVGADTWAVEVIPNGGSLAHLYRAPDPLTNNGIHIIENVKTDDMAAEAAATGRATFFFNMTVPKAVGLTGNFVAIEAIR